MNHGTQHCWMSLSTRSGPPTTFPVAPSVVHSPTCFALSQYSDRILVPSLRNHPHSRSAHHWGKAQLGKVQLGRHGQVRSPRQPDGTDRVLFTVNEQSPEFFAGQPVKESSLTQPFYRL